MFYVVKERYTSVKLKLSYVSCSFQHTFLLSFCAEFLSFQWRCPVFSACFVRFLIIFLTPRQTCKKYVHCIVLKLFYVRCTLITRQLIITAFSNRNLCLCDCLCYLRLSKDYVSWATTQRIYNDNIINDNDIDNDNDFCPYHLGAKMW